MTSPGDPAEMRQLGAPRWREIRRGSCASFALAALGVVAGRAAESPWCRPVAEIAAAVERLDPAAGACEANEPCWAERLAEAASLAAARPDDLHAQRLVQDLARGTPGLEGERLRADLLTGASERLREHPDDAVAHYLYARLPGAEHSLAHHRRALELAPDFPWSHLGVATAMARELGPLASPAEVQAELDAFLVLCPSRITDLLRTPGLVNDPAFWRRRLPAIREALFADASPGAVRLYPVLWGLELRSTTSAAGRPALEQIRRDLAALEARGETWDAAWWQALGSGFALVGDATGAERARRGLAAVAPCSREVVTDELGRWQIEGDALERHRAVYQESDRWLATCPDEFRFAVARFNAARSLPELPDETLLVEADRYLAAWDARQAEVDLVPSPYFQVAETFFRRGLAPRRIPALLAWETEVAGRERPLAEEPELRFLQQLSALLHELDVAALAVRAHLRLGEPVAARQALGRYEEILERLRGFAASRRLEVASAEARSWRLAGAVAEAEDRRADAFVAYRRALLLDPEGETREETVARIEALWRALDGTAEGSTVLAALTAAKETAATGWSEVDEELADFALVDLAGRPWTRADLAGKTVLINWWATWCAPCAGELPLVAALARRVAADPDLAVVTFNVDFDAGLIEPYLEERGLELPVLRAASAFADLGALSLPQSWIVDRTGRLRRRQVGFDADRAATWVEQALAEMAAVVGGG